MLPSLLILLLEAAGASTAWWWTHRQAPDDSIRLVTWNLQWFPGKSPNATTEDAAIHMKEVQAVLRKLDADILCLQEVRSGEAISELITIAPAHEIQVVSNFPRLFGHSQQLAITSSLNGITV